MNTTLEHHVESQCWPAQEVPVEIAAAEFGRAAGTREVHVSLTPLGEGTFADQLRWLAVACREAEATLGVGGEAIVFRRIFCSDLANQSNLLNEFLKADEAFAGECATSIVGQPPPAPVRVALWLYYVMPADGALEKACAGDSLIVRRGEVRHMWTSGLYCADGETSEAQTRAALETYVELLNEQGMTLEAHAQRTWYFVRDIDRNYGGLVRARRELFAEHGLVPETHYLASTGIQGVLAETEATVGMDAYAVAGLRPGQVEYLAALDHLGPTHRYGVTFERATALRYGDRSHVLISGTASIDAEGEILHPGDVKAQLERTLENMSALLAQTGAGLEDLAQMIIYVRETCDMARVQRLMRMRFPSTPMVVVAAAVCRPGWLVEIEGMAIIDNDTPQIAAF